MAGRDLDDKGTARRRPLVAFDFDGTLTFRDSFPQFLAWRVGARPFLIKMAQVSPAGARFVADRDRTALKAALVRAFLLGVTRSILEDEARRFAVARSAAILRPDALRAWELWRSRGARLVIVTASPETIIGPFARELGADRLIGTRLAFDTEDRVAGGFEGANCRGAEKVARLRQAFGEDVRLEAAYGDSPGDRDMLSLAAEPHYRVFGGGR